MVNDSVVADKNGVTAFNDQTMTGLNTYTYDLSAYASHSQVYVTFEAMCNYNLAYGWPGYVWVDEICIFNVTPCAYYAVSASIIDDVSCNGGSDGSAVATATNNVPPVSLSYLWSDGQISDTAVGLVAGTYTCIVSDTINGCADTATVTISEPSVMSLSALVIDESAPGAMDGQIDLTVSGGTPCITQADLACPLLGGNGQSGNAFNLINTYEGKDIPKGSVSMTLRFIFQSNTKSLLESDINGSIQMILKLLEKRLNAKIRSWI